LQFQDLLIKKPKDGLPLVQVLKARACYQMLVSIAMSREL